MTAPRSDPIDQQPLCTCQKLKSFSWDDHRDQAVMVGLRCALDDWDILRTAIQDGWAGSQRIGEMHRDELYGALSTLINGAKNADQELEDEIIDILDIFMSSKFNCDLEDGSMEFIARLLSQLRADCAKNDFSGLQIMVERNPSPPALLALALGEPIQSSPKCECVEPCKPAPIVKKVAAAPEIERPSDVDADGWQTVSYKSKSKRK
uniref:Pre-rRNA-processing protein TSR2 homolog n=1 Tax=Spongospora subterranea TaxID=70186 RepID=A0A0H5RA96_9EUKA|eukprot:CRZ11075.1 hypothetical protein [Spongospora subterranea]